MGFRFWSSAVLFAVFAYHLPGAAPCVTLYGARHEVPHYAYGYIGLDWPEEYRTCTGARQSPIHIPGHTGFNKVADSDATYMGYGQLASNGSNIKVVNNGHTVQVVFPAGYAPNASVVIRGDPSTAKLTTKFGTNSTASPQRVQLSPLQFHFHTRSEHVIDGKEYALELHIVNFVYAPTVPACGTGGCATVVGIMFEMVDDSDAAAAGNAFLQTIWSVMPPEEGLSAYIPAGKTLDFNQILPADRSYVTYEGSLTTPPCTEGILWHVLTQPMKITNAQLHKFKLAVGSTECTTHVDSGTTTRHLLNSGSSTSSGSQTARETAGTATTASESQFEVPTYQADSQDGKMCRKLAGQNYREVQDMQSRPVWFYAAPGLCDTQLHTLESRSKILKNLLDEAQSDDKLTLHQYKEIADAHLTKSEGCAGIGSGALAVKGATTVLMQALLAGLLLAWLLVDP